jgi:AcrR family transcriptional regulator
MTRTIRTRASAAPPISRVPKQDRSRASFERVLEAAAELMAEKGYAGFALTDVVKRAKVSIGSIYGRVDSKDELIRAVHQRVMSRLELEQADMFLRVRRRALPLPELLRTLIHEMAGFLQRNAPVLNAFMGRAFDDEVVMSFGKLAYRHTLTEFKMLLIERGSEIAMPQVEHAAQVCFDIIYSCLSRYFGVGRLPGNEDRGDLQLLVADLSNVCLAYLSSTHALRGSKPGHGQRSVARRGGMAS